MPNVNIWYVTPFYSQTKEIFDNKLMQLIEGVEYDIFSKINRSTFTLRFRKGGVLQFKSAENYQGMRGATLTHLICDEYAFFREGVRTQVLEPMLMVRGRKAIYCSTPKGKNDFYTLSQFAANQAPGWAEYFGTYADTGRPDLADFAESQRAILPPDVYRQEYEAEFVDGGGQVFVNIDRIFSLPTYAQPGKRHFAGIDLGQHNDRTVVVILNDAGQVVYFKRFELAEQTDSERLINLLADILKRYPTTEALVEKNFNPAVLDALRGRFGLKYAYAFTTTSQSKADIISNLIYHIDGGRISAPPTDVLRLELENYAVTHTEKTRAASYGAPAGLHDDCVIALALAVRLYATRMRTGFAYQKESSLN